MTQQTAAVRIMKARAALVLDHPFYGSLALRMKVIEAPDKTKTMGTDGSALYYAPEFIDKQSDVQLVGLLAHEVMHPAMGHHVRRGGRDPKRWNKAADYAINPLLVDAGFTLPDGGLIDPQYKGQNAEAIYRALPQDDDDGDPAGEVFDAPDPSESEAEWKVNVTQAQMVAKRMGQGSDGAQAAVEAAKKPASDWRAILRRFVQQTAAADYSWRVPNRRYAGSGFMLPALRSESMPPLVAIIDTSGSTSEFQSGFVNEIRAVVDEVRPEALYVVECDDRVHRVQRFEAGEAVTLQGGLYGQGGTSFVPAFDAIRERDIDPACAIYLTDGDGYFPSEAPPYPVLWALTPNAYVYGGKLPFGESVQLD